jgi:hypothetical protein
LTSLTPRQRISILFQAWLGRVRKWHRDGGALLLWVGPAMAFYLLLLGASPLILIGLVSLFYLPVEALVVFRDRSWHYQHPGYTDRLDYQRAQFDELSDQASALLSSRR